MQIHILLDTSVYTQQKWNSQRKLSQIHGIITSFQSVLNSEKGTWVVTADLPPVSGAPICLLPSPPYPPRHSCPVQTQHHLRIPNGSTHPAVTWASVLASQPSAGQPSYNSVRHFKLHTSETISTILHGPFWATKLCLPQNWIFIFEQCYRPLKLRKSKHQSHFQASFIFFHPVTPTLVSLSNWLFQIISTTYPPSPAILLSPLLSLYLPFSCCSYHTLLMLLIPLCLKEIPSISWRILALTS